mgnify:CR=1 FL=1
MTHTPRVRPRSRVVVILAGAACHAPSVRRRHGSQSEN